MTDPLPQIAAMVVLCLLALGALGTQLGSIVRESDSWVVVRGLARGRYSRLRQSLRRDHRG